MKPSRIPAGALALAACVLFPGASRADNAPYSIQANPAGQVAEAEALCRGHAEQMADILTGRLKVVISRAA